MNITSIEDNEKNKSMARVFIDDKTSFCLPKKRISELNIIEGKNIEAETLDYILTSEVYAAAKSAAVKYLATKLRTACEISQKLSELGYEQDMIDKVIENLVEIDYIDDYKYAVKYISEKTKLKPKSLKMLSMELSFKGISDDIIDRALEEISLDDDMVAYELLKKRFSKYTVFDEKLIQKMRSFLMNRGFSYHQISAAISQFLPDD